MKFSSYRFLLWGAQLGISISLGVIDLFRMPKVLESPLLWLLVLAEFFWIGVVALATFIHLRRAESVLDKEGIFTPLTLLMLVDVEDDRESSPRPELKYRRCERCKALLPPANTYCPSCGTRSSDVITF